MDNFSQSDIENLIRIAQIADEKKDYKVADNMDIKLHNILSYIVEAKKKKKKMHCWKGYHRVPGTKPGSADSCEKD